MLEGLALSLHSPRCIFLKYCSGDIRELSLKKGTLRNTQAGPTERIAGEHAGWAHRTVVRSLRRGQVGCNEMNRRSRNVLAL